jgi:hypothetical protein
VPVRRNEIVSPVKPSRAEIISAVTAEIVSSVAFDFRGEAFTAEMFSNFFLLR